MRALPEIVTEGVYRFRLGRSNAYLVRQESGDVLVDTGLPAHGRRVLAMMERLKIDPSSVKKILLTHRHLDHCGAAAELSQLCGAEVVVHRADAAAVEGHERLSPARGLLGNLLEPLVEYSDQNLFGFRPCKVTAVDEGWQYEDLRLLHLPGHTPGHSGYLHEPSGVVFCGDAAINWGVRLVGPSRTFTVDLEQVKRSQRRLADMGAWAYCFGHGTPLFAGSRAMLRLSQR